MRPAVFLDRDGTIIEHVHHLRRVEDVRLIPGTAGALAALREAGFATVVVTNQSVVGRGMLDLAGLAAIHERMEALLEKGGARLDGIYFCTEVPGTSDQTAIEHSDRKPGPGMLLRAAQELGLDLGRSYMVGDSLSDLWAGKNAGVRESLLVLTGYGEKTRERGLAEKGPLWRTAPSIVEVADFVLTEWRNERS